MIQQVPPRVAVVGPGAERWIDGPFAPGATRITLADAHPADLACLVDESTSHEELAALWRFRCDGVVLASRGAWSSGPGRLEDSADHPHEARSTVDVALPGPLLGSVAQVSALLPALRRFRPIGWSECSRRWAAAGVPVASLRLRPAGSALAELHGTALPRSRVRMGWRVGNLVALPDAERRGASLCVPAPGVAVVGAHRSGTTMMAHLLGQADHVETMREKRCLRTLVDGHAPGRTAPGGSRADRFVWHATFLAPCERLVSAVCARLPLIAMIRSPDEIVRSMLHNWQGLDDVARLLERTGGDLPRSRLDSAISIVHRSWRNLLQATQTGQEAVILDYATCVRQPDHCVEAAYARLGFAVSIRPGLARFINKPAVAGELEGGEKRRVMAQCADLYQRLRAQAV